VKQAGSLVDRSRLRFDFSHFAGVAVRRVEGALRKIVNRQVLADTKVETLWTCADRCRGERYTRWRLFGEKYGDVVRVVTIGGLGGFFD